MKKPPALKRNTAQGLMPFRGKSAAQLIPDARLAGPMPWVIAIMVALTVIAAAGGLALNNLATNARADLAGGATVQILEAAPAERERQAQAAALALEQSPAVASIRRVSDEELDALLEPWLGVGVDEETVPVPALIDIRLREEATEQTLNQLRGMLIDIAPSARVDAQASWLGPVFGAIASLQYLSAALVILLGLTSAAAVWLAARSALGTNQDTIEIVHLLGGTDRQIARIFERSIGFDATLGGIAGLALGLIGVFVLGQQFARLGSGMVAGGGLGWIDWLLIACIPVIGVLVAVVTSRMTVIAALRRLL